MLRFVNLYLTRLFLHADRCSCYDSLAGTFFLLFLQADNSLYYDSLVVVSSPGGCDSVTCRSFFYSYRLITACVLIR